MAQIFISPISICEFYVVNYYITCFRQSFYNNSGETGPAVNLRYYMLIRKIPFPSFVVGLFYTAFF